MPETRRRVLVVEDDAATRSLLCETLIDEGYEIRAANNGKEALDLLRRWTADVVVLDLLMPVMDGWEFRVAQRAVPEYRDIPVVALSAARQPSIRSEMLDAVAVLEKPFDLDRFIEVVAAATRFCRPPFPGRSAWSFLTVA